MGYVSFTGFVKYILICLNVGTSLQRRQCTQEIFVVKFRDTQQQTSQYNTNLEARCKFFKLYMYF